MTHNPFKASEPFADRVRMTRLGAASHSLASASSTGPATSGPTAAGPSSSSPSAAGVTVADSTQGVWAVLPESPAAQRDRGEVRALPAHADRPRAAAHRAAVGGWGRLRRLVRGRPVRGIAAALVAAPVIALGWSTGAGGVSDAAQRQGPSESLAAVESPAVPDLSAGDLAPGDLAPGDSAPGDPARQDAAAPLPIAGGGGLPSDAGGAAGRGDSAGLGSGSNASAPAVEVSALSTPSTGPLGEVLTPAAVLKLLRSLDLARARAFSGGRVSAAADFAEPGSPYLLQSARMLEELSTRGLRAVGLRTDIVDVSALKGVDRSTLQAEVADRRLAYVLVDSTGNVTRRVPEAGIRHWRVTLAKGESGWRIRDVVSLDASNG